ncbi:phosphoribosylanthranilate isomerase [Salinibacterium hongtaonis]|uniref:N-(5'-phosphoribosyl)anthranilate isomerase n=1 Tax=Homoserinimonas hongtaonis TaxID=2079791 RepID=A0A2U1T2M5_9MICO|nr:phosphoribosylanthranilate isomerase [Salinibacterium hongtaonis]AWB88383.1 phosphoribosylanthranilate isomerase [Salinibacterium hongtaonis]PWB98141.1 phosphoribosylanthranilate isomerase [Salinibacterium hongtaonis]
MFVKICGLREERHVETCLEERVDAIGFVLTPSPRFVAPERARHLVNLVDDAALTVGVFRDETVDEIERLAEAAGVGAVQVHGQRTRAELAKLTRPDRKLIRAVSFDDPSIEENWGEDMLLVDAPHPGSGQAWDYASMAASLTRRDGTYSVETGEGPARRWILAGGLTPENVAAAIEAANPWGVDVSSGVEASPGVKSSQLIREFMAAAR